jgi:hypothetical protein
MTRHGSTVLVEDSGYPLISIGEPRMSEWRHRLYARDPGIERGPDDPMFCACGEPWPCDTEKARRLWNAYVEATAGRGHGGPHDRSLCMDSDAIATGHGTCLIQDDCVRCAAAQYGTEAELQQFLPRDYDLARSLLENPGGTE